MESDATSGLNVRIEFNCSTPSWCGAIARMCGTPPHSCNNTRVENWWLESSVGDQKWDHSENTLNTLVKGLLCAKYLKLQRRMRKVLALRTNSRWFLLLNSSTVSTVEKQ